MVSYQNTKVWAHRANSVEKLERAIPLFDGVELDVVISDHCLDIYHPPEESMGLCLYEYLGNLKAQDRNLQFWLDVKNLRSDNLSTFVTLLYKSLKEHQLDQTNFLVESTDHKLLPQLKASGFKTSYYLPSISQSPEKTKIISEIRKNAESAQLNVLSTDIINYPYLTSNFPEYTKLVWVLELKGKKKDLYYQALSDPTVEVILIPFNY